MNSPRSRILILDDSQENILLLSYILTAHGYGVTSTHSGREALEKLAQEPYDMAILDIDLPDMSGFEICTRMKADPSTQTIPVLFISAAEEASFKVMAFSVGGQDYITKPFQVEEVVSRVKTHLQLRSLQHQLQENNAKLEQRVRQQMQEIVESQLVTIFALAKLTETRDDDTGMHIERTRVFCSIIAKHAASHEKMEGAISRDFIETIYHTAPLHDIGKVGISDGILLKRGKLEAHEFEIMKRHTLIGASTLATVREKYPHNSFIEMGIQIARSHHERWDGAGYPDGLVAEQIPLPARIMSLSDVYDALRSQRVYKPAFSHEHALELISLDAGKRFDPALVQAFMTAQEEIRSTYELMCDVSA